VPVICGLSFTQTSGATVTTAAAFASAHTPPVLAHALGETPTSSTAGCGSARPRARAGESRHDPAPHAMPEADSAVKAKLAEEEAAFVGDLSGTDRFTVAVRLTGRHIAEELVALAVAHNVDLLVVGTHHAHPARPWSVAAGAVHLARMAVATVPAAPPGAAQS